MTLRRVMPVLLVLCTAMLLAPSASATPFVDGECEGVMVAGEFTGSCPNIRCYCPDGVCYDYFVQGYRIVQVC